MRKIIFLDIDGVLNSLPYFNRVKNNEGFDEISPFHLKLLAKIYHATNAEIVLSSTWRNCKDSTDDTCKEMYQYLETSLASYKMKISDIIPIINYNRPYEIKKWLETHINEEIRFISLDDDFSYDDYKRYNIEHCLIQTSYFCLEEKEGGLQEAHVNLAIQKLNS